MIQYELPKQYKVSKKEAQLVESAAKSGLKWYLRGIAVGTLILLLYLLLR